MCLMACTTDPSTSEEKVSDPLKQVVAPYTPEQIAACRQQWQGEPCDSTQTAPTFCYAQLGGSWVAARGGNPCLAKRDLQLKACTHLSTTYALPMDCKPDSSEGHCPPGPPACTPTGEAAECVAYSYDGVEVKNPGQLKGAGNNSCRARFRLEEVACNRNLNPRKLGNIQCTRASMQAVGVKP